MKITKQRLIKLIKEAMYNPHSSIESRLEKIPPKERQKIQNLLNDPDQEMKIAGMNLLDMYDYSGPGFETAEDVEDYEYNFIGQGLNHAVPGMTELKKNDASDYSKLINLIQGTDLKADLNLGLKSKTFQKLTGELPPMQDELDNAVYYGKVNILEQEIPAYNIKAFNIVNPQGVVVMSYQDYITIRSKLAGYSGLSLDEIDTSFLDIIFSNMDFRIGHIKIEY